MLQSLHNIDGLSKNTCFISFKGDVKSQTDAKMKNFPRKDLIVVQLFLLMIIALQNFSAEKRFPAVNLTKAFTRSESFSCFVFFSLISIFSKLKNQK